MPSFNKRLANQPPFQTLLQSHKRRQPRSNPHQRPQQQSKCQQQTSSRSYQQQRNFQTCLTCQQQRNFQTCLKHHNRNEKKTSQSLFLRRPATSFTISLCCNTTFCSHALLLDYGVASWRSCPFPSPSAFP